MESTLIHQEVIHVLSLGRATAVASASCDSMADVMDPSTFVILTKQRVQLDIAKKQFQLDFFDALSGLSPVERSDVVFDLVDKNCDGTINLYELARTLQCINGDDCLDDDLPLAAQSIKLFDKDNDGKLSKAEFPPFLQALSKIMHCKQWELSQHICTVVSFQSETGSTIVYDTVRKMMGNHVLSEDELTDACHEARLLLTFDMLDTHQSGDISLKDFCTYLLAYQDIHYSIPEQIIKMLDLMNRHSTRMGYEQFSEVFRTIIEVTSMDLNVLINCVTLAVVESMDSRESIDKANRDQVLQNDSIHQEEESPEINRIEQLFEIFDSDGNGSVDLAELVLGFRKFQADKQIDESLGESFRALLSADENGDHVLDCDEFAQLILNFSVACKVDIADLVDFMIAQSVLVDDNVDETRYVCKQVRELSLTT